jgi:hypothetical protein
MLFLVFLVMDAPTQISLANIESDKLRRENISLRAQSNARNSKGLFIECHDGLPPSIMPEAARLYVMTVFGQQTPHLSEMFGTAGSTMAWPKNGAMTIIAGQCVVTNYSDDVLTSITLRPVVMFYTTNKLSPGHYEGRGIYKEIEGDVEIRKIDTGPSNSFVFYIMSQSSDFVDISMPNIAFAQRLGKQENVVIPITTDGVQLHFDPFSNEVVK